MDENTALPVFASASLRFVCISDTHNDDCRRHIPEGDILLHAGDLTDFGTMDEMRAAVDWISSLPHAVKVIVAGNHDMGLDSKHPDFSPDVKSLLTSNEARKAGIRYLDREVETVCYFTSADGTRKPLRFYGNPMQPEFLGKPYAFIYPPAPSAQATAAWESAPAPRKNDSDVQPIDVWLMHSPPFGRLDLVPVPGLTGCSVQAEKIAAARPRLCVFGHYHYSWGVERVRWRDDCHPSGQGGGDSADVALLVASVERQAAEGFKMPIKTDFDFTGSGEEMKLIGGEETVYVNAGWMTMLKDKTEYRNPPFVITLPLD